MLSGPPSALTKDHSSLMPLFSISVGHIQLSSNSQPPKLTPMNGGSLETVAGSAVVSGSSIEGSVVGGSVGGSVGCSVGGRVGSSVGGRDGSSVGGCTNVRGVVVTGGSVGGAEKTSGACEVGL